MAQAKGLKPSHGFGGLVAVFFDKFAIWGLPNAPSYRHICDMVHKIAICGLAEWGGGLFPDKN